LAHSETSDGVDIDGVDIDGDIVILYVDIPAGKSPSSTLLPLKPTCPAHSYFSPDPSSRGASPAHPLRHTSDL
jgi:hypothetical protein